MTFLVLKQNPSAENSTKKFTKSILYLQINFPRDYIYLIPAIPSTRKLSLVNVPVLSKQQISIFPANGILNGSVQNTSGQNTQHHL